MTRGFIDIQDETRELNGLRAVYSVAELDQIAGLPLGEALVIHTLKALCGGEIHDSADAALGPQTPHESLLPDPGTQKGPASTPHRRRGEPLLGQTSIAV